MRVVHNFFFAFGGVLTARRLSTAALVRYRASAFHRVNLSLPGLELVHSEPYIFVHRQFLSKAECAALREKAAATLAPQTFDNDATAGVRTSRGCVARSEEVASLRQRLAGLASVELGQLQPLKISRYEEGARFDIHTDAWRGDLQGAPPDPDDWWADRARLEYGVRGAPISGVNRIVTIFVYLTTCVRGGRTRWRWTDYDAALGGNHGRAFYEQPGPGTGATDVAGGSGAGFSISPEEGMAVVHFPATSARSGGYTDYNAYHESEAAVDDKWVLQQFVWSHSKLAWPRVLDAENLEPERCLSPSQL